MALAGIKGYITNLRACADGTPVTAEFVITAYTSSSRSRWSFRNWQKGGVARRGGR